MQLNYAVMEKERARHALMADARAPVPPVPRSLPDGPDRDARCSLSRRGVPPTAGIGKSITPEPAPEVAPAPVAAVFKAPAEDEFVDDAVYKGFKKMRKKLGKKVLAGEMTVDEARSRMGRQFAQKGSRWPRCRGCSRPPSQKVRRHSRSSQVRRSPRA